MRVCLVSSSASVGLLAIGLVKAEAEKKATRARPLIWAVLIKCMFDGLLEFFLEAGCSCITFESRDCLFSSAKACSSDYVLLQDEYEII